MSKNESKQKQTPPPKITYLTLPTPEGGGILLERATAALLIQRGDLAAVYLYRGVGYDVALRCTTD